MFMFDRTDAQLIGDYLDGDEAAFRSLVERHLRPVYGFIRRFMGDAAEAQDISQEVFIRLWKNLGQYRDGQSFKAWLFAIARNASVDWLRRKRPAAFSEFDDADGGNYLADNLADPSPLPDELASAAEDGVRLAVLVDRLPAHYRAVIALRRDAGLTFEEIATVLDKPMDTVKSHYRRALAALRRSLTED